MTWCQSNCHHLRAFPGTAQLKCVWRKSRYFCPLGSTYCHELTTAPNGNDLRFWITCQGTDTGNHQSNVMLAETWKPVLLYHLEWDRYRESAVIK